MSSADTNEPGEMIVFSDTTAHAMAVLSRVASAVAGGGYVGGVRVVVVDRGPLHIATLGLIDIDMHATKHAPATLSAHTKVRGKNPWCSGADERKAWRETTRRRR